MHAATKQAYRIFKERNGTLRTSEALRAGIHPRSLYGMRDRGEVEQIARGLFRLADLPPLGEPDLLTIAKKVPQAVFCLLTALAFHRLTTQIPHAVEVALPRTARVPRLDHPPIKVFRFSPESLTAGIETHILDGVALRIYCREKTLADIFKYRNKVGSDVAMEALRSYRSQPNRDFQTVMKYARICRVEKVIRPYLEAIL
ncbi:MAG: type IV toxin-antitoxin system AbiEi family antitoxin domain-containing protein [Phycisphaerae bacterium]|jgi:predicted transcriptional regulator of viral defense system